MDLNDIINRDYEKIIGKIVSGVDVSLRLFQCVKEAYEKNTGLIMPETADPKCPEVQCRQIWEWYSEKYSIGAEVWPGQSRSVNRTTDENSYAFGRPYELIQFRGNLLEREQVSPNFIQHIAVAFGFDIDTCNECLGLYGYTPLHAKNVHNLAVYSVLSTTGGNVEGKNALLMVRDRYFAACDILRQQRKKMQGSTSIDTRLLVSEIEAHKSDFDEERFIEYIAKNSMYLNWRHSALLDEFFRLLKALRFLYVAFRFDGKDKYAAVWGAFELRYSLFGIYNSFSEKIEYNLPSGGQKRKKEYKDKLFQKDLFERIHEDIGKDSRFNRHPTREAMIFLWLYQMMFMGAAPIMCPKRFAMPFGAKYCKEMNGEYYFDIHGYLFGTEPVRESAEIKFRNNTYSADIIFNGSEAKEIINHKLSYYGFDIIYSGRGLFDAVVSRILETKLFRVKLRKQDDGRWIYEDAILYRSNNTRDLFDLCEDGRFAEILNMNSAENGGIPIMLLLFREILERLTMITAKADNVSQQYVLPFRLYNQL